MGEGAGINRGDWIHTSSTQSTHQKVICPIHMSRLIQKAWIKRLGRKCCCALTECVERLLKLSELVISEEISELPELAFKIIESNIEKIKMLAVSPKISSKMIGDILELFAAEAGVKNTNQLEAEVDLSPYSSIQLVSVPDSLVVKLGGVFQKMTTMEQVRFANRDLPLSAVNGYWTIRTHMHNMIEPTQRRCAHTLILVGARLYSQYAPKLLSALPNEMWVLVLEWLLRSELGA